MIERMNIMVQALKSIDKKLAQPEEPKQPPSQEIPPAPPSEIKI